MIGRCPLLAHSALLIVADGLAGDSEAIGLKSSEQADIVFQSAPADSPPTESPEVRNLWQHGERALLFERFYGFEVVRANSVAALTGVNS